MRFLVACQSCKRQFDASKLPTGSRFHCHCGTVVTIPEIRAQDAAVVRCSSCGGPRNGNARCCGFCGAEFTLHEQDLQTLCPNCMTRVRERARFCHHCGTRIQPDGEAGRPSDNGCPACGDERNLNHRTLGDPPIAMLECPGCAGLWLGQSAFQSMLERFREEAQQVENALAARPGSDDRGRGRQRGSLYRRCPECSKHMHRMNYGQRSGVIVDTCREHGVWFDAQELDAILRWIRAGGEARAKQRIEEEARAAEVRDRFSLEPKTAESSWSSRSRDLYGNSGFLGGLIGGLFGG
jgi:Zn-finger nucleic acid-binding protein